MDWAALVTAVGAAVTSVVAAARVVRVDRHVRSWIGTTEGVQPPERPDQSDR